MPFQLDLFSEMEECDQDVSVVDVYDIASEIGKEFEKIIDTHGTEAVTSLLPKVINALEHLERLATKNDRENTTVQELRTRITHLENDKIEKAEGRLRFEKELEQIEEHWRQESRDLLSMVTRLQDENRRLSSSLAERDGMRDDGSGPGGGQGDSLDGGAMTGDWELLCRLRQTVERQREAVRSRDNEILAKNSEIESLQEQVERLSMVGRELRRKHHSAQAQVRGLVDERADFLAQLQDQQREIGRLRQRLGIAQKENEDLTESLDQNPSFGERYHPDDPERPRFTTAELKEILHERNELKARVSDLEDELETYRPKAKHEEEEKAEEDAPVQGPLPFEPDDAPWKRSDSGIRKLIGQCMYVWEDPHDSAVYSLASDNNNTFLSGLSQHGRIQLWDKRKKNSVQTYFAKVKRSSPVYSVAFDPVHLFAALDQSLSVLDFSGRGNISKNLIAVPRTII